MEWTRARGSERMFYICFPLKPLRKIHVSLEPSLQDLSQKMVTAKTSRKVGAHVVSLAVSHAREYRGALETVGHHCGDTKPSRRDRLAELTGNRSCQKVLTNNFLVKFARKF